MRRRRQGAALRQVGRLPHPAPEARGRQHRENRAVAAPNRRGPAGAAARRPNRLRRGSRVPCAAAAPTGDPAAAHAGWRQVRGSRPPWCRCQAGGNSPAPGTRRRGRRARRPSGAWRHRVPVHRATPASPCQGQAGDAAPRCRSRARNSAPTRERVPAAVARARDSRCGACVFSFSVSSMLVVLTSMPITWARGQRNATLAAWDVPQPATRMLRSSRYGCGGPEQAGIGAPAVVGPPPAIAVQSRRPGVGTDGAHKSGSPPALPRWHSSCVLRVLP